MRLDTTNRLAAARFPMVPNYWIFFIWQGKKPASFQEIETATVQDASRIESQCCLVQHSSAEAVQASYFQHTNLQNWYDVEKDCVYDANRHSTRRDVEEHAFV